jgi:hypothetical protein
LTPEEIFFQQGGTNHPLFTKNLLNEQIFCEQDKIAMLPQAQCTANGIKHPGGLSTAHLLL